MKEQITDELNSIHSLELDLKYKGNKNILNILAE